MAEKDSEGLEGTNLGDSPLQADIAHWAEVLDRWIKGVDARLGTEEGRVAPLDEADDGPDAEA